MPEAFAVLFVFVVALASYAGARIYAANPLNHNPLAEVKRLRQHRAWLEERLWQASRERWEPEMLARISEEIEATDAQLAKAASQLRDAA